MPELPRVKNVEHFRVEELRRCRDLFRRQNCKLKTVHLTEEQIQQFYFDWAFERAHYLTHIVSLTTFVNACKRGDRVQVYGVYIKLKVDNV